MQSVQQTVSCDSFQLQVVSTWWLEDNLVITQIHFGWYFTRQH